MGERFARSFVGKVIVTGLVIAAVGVVIQIASGADYPSVPPAFFILLIPAGLVAFGRWRWTLVMATLGGLFLTLGLFLSGASARLFDLSRFGVSVGLWIQALAVIVATTAGIIATVQNYRREAPGIARNGTQSAASAEYVMVVRHPQAGTGRQMNITLRGVEPAAFSARDEVQVIEGRPFQSGRYEVIVGQAAAQRLGNLTIGRPVRWGGYSWDVVGVFQADGGSVESEIWCDVGMLQQAFRRQTAFQVVYAKLESAQSFDLLRTALAKDSRLDVDVRQESVYYAEQSRSLTTMITTAGVFIAVLMGAGAIFAAVSTMYTAVASRTREIATLRAIGFGSTAVVCSVLAEAVMLASAGGAVGALAAWLLFDGYAVSTLNFQSMSQVAFAFAVTPALIAQGIAAAVAMGLVGAMWPAWRAATLSVASGLRKV